MKGKLVHSKVGSGNPVKSKSSGLLLEFVLHCDAGQD
jgi:hypothetical protein